MIKTARQLKDLIRNLSKDKSADAQILMRNYMMERASRPTIAATSIPPLRMNLSRYSEREMRSRNRSIM